jgi:membrane-bound ClpP family serine protease
VPRRKASPPLNGHRAATFPASLAGHVNIAEETGPLRPPLLKLAQTRGAALLAFIAPYRTERVSPIQERGPFIGLPEEFAIQHAVEELLKHDQPAKDNRRICVLVNSPGGLASSSYKVARVIRDHYGDVTVFVPHIAASGASLITLAADRIVMGMISEITPVDTQVSYGQDRVSALSMIRALSRLSVFFQRITRDEAPYPWRAMADKLDPVLLQDWTTTLEEVAAYAADLMTRAGYKEDKRKGIVEELVFTQYTHSHVICREKAIRIGLKVSNDAADQEALKLMRDWLSTYFMESGGTHYVRFISPKKEKFDGPKENAAGEAQD